MRRKLLLLVICFFLITGCTIEKINTNNYDDLINKILLKENNINNNIASGYSYYIPNGLMKVNMIDNNILLRDKYNNYYYFYSDVVSYYHKVENSYKEESSSFYSKKIIDNDSKKSGYLEINEIKNKYYVEAMYNYVKIEVYTSKEFLDDVITNIFLVLSSVKYNDKVLSTTIGDKILDYKEESFNIFTTKKSTTNYLDYIEKYDSGAYEDNNKENKFSDDDVVDLDIFEE